MSGFWERVRNVFTDELQHPSENRHLVEAYAVHDQLIDVEMPKERAAGREEVATYLTEKLATIEMEIRSRWEESLVWDGIRPFDSSQSSETINEHYKGQVSAYNEIATAIHDLENQSKINLPQLPAILDQESVQRGVSASANAEIAQDKILAAKEEQEVAREDLKIAAAYRFGGPSVGDENPSIEEALDLGREHDAEQFVRSYERDNPGLSSTELLEKFRQEYQLQTSIVEHLDSSRITLPVQQDSVAVIFANHEERIREEWQRDLQTGQHSPHDLETYFAGKIDQHNMLLETAISALPEVRESLPQQISFAELKSNLEHEQSQQQEYSQNAHSFSV